MFTKIIHIFFFTFTSLLILTWNFPGLSKVIYSKPIYYEDLTKDTPIEKKELKTKIIYNIENSDKFKTRFIIFQQLIISIIIGLMADYIKSRFYINNEYSTLEFLGIIGGLISLMLKLIRVLGRFSLFILYKQKKKEQISSTDISINDNIVNDNIVNDNIINDNNNIII